MRILFLTPELPEPPDQGGKLRNRALIGAAAAHHQVDVLSFGPPRPSVTPRSEGDAAGSLPADGGGSGREDGPSVLARCRRVVTIPAPGPRSLLRRVWDLWFDQVPDLAHRRASTEYHRALWDLLEQERYDVVQIEGLEMMPYLGAVRAGAPRAAVVYDAHNAEMTLQRTIWQTELRDPRRWHGAVYSFLQWSKLGTYERVMMNATDMVLAVAPEDAARLKGRHVEPEIVPNGVGRLPPARVPAGEGGAKRAPTLLFIGPQDYRPNADAAHWLVRSILPAVRARRPEARLRLVGRGTERLAGPGVDALGYVDDVAAEFTRADVLVVPMRMGGGVRFKVLEAMAVGLPVVSTPAGLAGIAAEPERHALVGRSAAELADAVVRLLDDAELGPRLASMARRLIEGRYTWERITPGYLRLLTTARRTARANR